MRRLAPTRLLLVPFLALLALAARQDPAAAKKVELELVYLANEGFLARVGDAKLLIDAFVTKPYSIYAAVPAELQAKLIGGEPPFDGLDLALASHVHADHFQTSAAAEVLSAHPNLAFVSSPQVIEALRIGLGGDESARFRELLPESRQTAESTHEGIRVELLRLPHTGGERTELVQNLGCWIELGGVRLLHVGDADLESADLAAYELAQREIDVALVPYWWLGSPESLARVKALVGARRLVAMHVPPKELEDVRRQLAALDPEILCFEQAGAAQQLAFDAR